MQYNLVPVKGRWRSLHLRHLLVIFLLMLTLSHRPFISLSSLLPPSFHLSTYSHLASTPFSFLLTLSHLRILLCCNLFFVVLSGDIELLTLCSPSTSLSCHIWSHRHSSSWRLLSYGNMDKTYHYRRTTHFLTTLSQLSSPPAINKFCHYLRWHRFLYMGTVHTTSILSSTFLILRSIFCHPEASTFKNIYLQHLPPSKHISKSNPWLVFSFTPCHTIHSPSYWNHLQLLTGHIS